jgi:YidC/Oxa1 family membrane protein insertase
MEAFGMDLSMSASKELSAGGILQALPYLVLIAIVAVTGFIQQRQIQGRNPNATVNPQQQMIMKVLPIFLPVISFTLPAGLVLYFAVSNLYRIGQQAFISRSIYGISRADKAEKKAKEAAKETTGGDRAKGGKAVKDAPAKRLTPKSGGGAPAKGATKRGSAKGTAKSTVAEEATEPVAEDDAGPPAAKPSSTPAKAAPSGQGQTNGGTKPAGKRTQGSRQGRSGSSTSSGSTNGGRQGDSTSPPALQPRARKPKKR